MAKAGKAYDNQGGDDIAYEEGNEEGQRVRSQVVPYVAAKGQPKEDLEGIGQREEGTCAEGVAGRSAIRQAIAWVNDEFTAVTDCGYA